MPDPSFTTPLDRNWTFRKASEDAANAHTVARVPTNIHLDLLEHGLIPDPFFAQNEKKVQWVGEEEWVYATRFPTPQGAEGKTTHLEFEGLDTYAVVSLNGKEILKSDNMFIPYRLDVTELLVGEDDENVLEILFESAFIKGKKIQEQYPDFAWGVWNGDASRTAVRKAQYHYGWDWGPMLMTCGPWRPVYLTTFSTRISDFYFTVDVPEDLTPVKLEVAVHVSGTASKAVFSLRPPGGGPVECEVGEVSEGKAVGHFTISDPKLWFPTGYGDQPLYELSATLDEGEDTQVKSVGLRRVELVEDALENEDGTSFFFRVNGIPIWSAGVNWIPADNFIPRLTPEKYRRWLTLIKECGHVMVRVWGGGIYEEKVFYDICDELGLMVWQDFAFGCGNYPAVIPEFRENVKNEAIATVKRLREHPSIVIYAGNNEDYSYMWSIDGHLGYDPSDTDPESWLKTQFPARYIYEKILPEAVAEYSGGVLYHRGSPYGSPEKPSGSDYTRGDIHQWNVWHGTQEPYQEYPSLAGRFVSEFGMAAYPSIETIKSYLPSPPGPEYNPFSATVEWHNKADGAERRIALYLAENFRFRTGPFEDFVFYTQLLQSEALVSAYSGWRRRWQGPGREYVSGALVWQINDCWPVTSWAIVDYYYRPKIAYYSIRRALEKTVLGVQRRVVKKPKNPYTGAFIDTEHRISIWASTFSLTALESVSLEVEAFDVSSGGLLDSHTLKKDFTLQPNRAVELADEILPGWNGSPDGDRHVVVAANLQTSSGERLAQWISWPEPLKYVALSKEPGVSLVSEEDYVKVQVTKPVKCLVLEVDWDAGNDVQWEDQGFDIVPGEEKVVKATGLGGRKVSVAWSLNH